MFPCFCRGLLHFQITNCSWLLNRVLIIEYCLFMLGNTVLFFNDDSAIFSISYLAFLRLYSIFGLVFDLALSCCNIWPFIAIIWPVWPFGLLLSQYVAFLELPIIISGPIICNWADLFYLGKIFADSVFL